MGLKHSSCYSSNCLDNEYNTGGDEHKQYSNIRNITTPSSSNNSSYKVDKDIEEIDQTFDEMIQQTSQQIDSNYDNINSHDTYLMEHNNNDSDSNESVLTAISPTKDRHLRDHSIGGIVDQLYMNNLYNNEETVHKSSWTDLENIIASGDLNELVSFIQNTKISLKNIRFKNKGYTPLHMAVSHNHIQMVQFITQEGVNINIKDDDGVTAIGLAYSSGSNDIITMLMKMKAEEFSYSPHSPYAPSSTNTSVKGGGGISAKHMKGAIEFSTQRKRCDSRESFDSFTFTTTSQSLDGDSNKQLQQQQEQQHQAQLETRDVLNLQSPIRVLHVMRSTSDYAIGITESFIEDDDNDIDNSSRQQTSLYDKYNNMKGIELMMEIPTYEQVVESSLDHHSNSSSKSNSKKSNDNNIIPKRSFNKIRKVASKAVTAFMKPLSSSSTATSTAVDGMPPRPPTSINKIHAK